MDLVEALVTGENIEEIRQKVGFVDLQNEIEPGMVVSVNRFQRESGQGGAILVIHTNDVGHVIRIDRAGICFGANSEWGNWDDETETVELDEADGEGMPVVYDVNGRRIAE